jgi:hypothetical protein
LDAAFFSSVVDLSLAAFSLPALSSTFAASSLLFSLPVSSLFASFFSSLSDYSLLLFWSVASLSPFSSGLTCGVKSGPVVPLSSGGRSKKLPLPLGELMLLESNGSFSPGVPGSESEGGGSDTGSCFANQA